jgi:hypothetical protein
LSTVGHGRRLHCSIVLGGLLITICQREILL